jgi:hypothetical protein
LWLIEIFMLRSFKASRYQPNDHSITNNGRLKHLGFLYSVWDNPSLDTINLGYYNIYDGVVCLKSRMVNLGQGEVYKRWLGWLIVVSTDAIPVGVIAALCGASYFFGISSIIFFMMGVILGLQLETILCRFLKVHNWPDDIFLNGMLCTQKSLGAMMCILEGPEGELLLTLTKVVHYENFTRRYWFDELRRRSCPCCEPILPPISSNLNV